LPSLGTKVNPVLRNSLLTTKLYCRGKKHGYADVMDAKRLTITVKGKGKAKEEPPPSLPPEERPRMKKRMEVEHSQVESP
jgi:hypothetical protein